jgi:iron(III) transport system ATP-binding protein
MKAASIRFEHVRKLYGDVAAVDDISFDIAAGTLVTLLGPSGCGKTTTLRMIAGLELPSSGTIRIGGEDVTRVPASERDVSMVFQSYALFPHMTVRENVAYGLTVSRLPKRDVEERTRTGLATVGLTGFDARLPSELSGGQQQRVAVARALVLEPSVLLFDEPLSNLDARLRRQMREEIRDLQRRLSLTVVYVTHDQSEAMAVSDRIIVMNKGGIAQAGAPRELYEHPQDVFVAGFMGEANRVRGVLRHVDARLGEVALGPLVLTLPHGGIAAGPIDVAIRPEAITIGDNGAGLAGTVRKAAYLGGLMEYTIDTVLGPLFVIDMAVDKPHAVGSAVGLRLANHGVVPIATGDARD